MKAGDATRGGEMDRDEFARINRLNWDERVDIHADDDGEFYNIEAFLRGGCALRRIETEALGDVRGRSMLHLLCHFGLDTLSWARRGAVVTGVDFSEKAVALARSLARRAGLAARFETADVYGLPARLADEPFDIVFASYGVLCWLADLPGFLRIVARHLRPGGTFFLADGHPFGDMLEYDPQRRRLDVREPYFHQPAPERVEAHFTYTSSDRPLRQAVHYEWTHHLAELLRAVGDAGLRLVDFGEYPFAMFRKFPVLERGDDGFWHWPAGFPAVPLLFSLKAEKGR
jgi:SAM-dependent methyltransferase